MSGWGALWGPSRTGLCTRTRRAATEGLAQAVVEEVDSGDVAVADRAHHGDFPLEELHAIVLGEDTGGRHAVEVVDREAVASSKRRQAGSPDRF